MAGVHNQLGKGLLRDQRGGTVPTCRSTRASAGPQGDQKSNHPRPPTTQQSLATFLQCSHHANATPEPKPPASKGRCTILGRHHHNQARTALPTHTPYSACEHWRQDNTLAGVLQQPHYWLLANLGPAP